MDRVNWELEYYDLSLEELMGAGLCNSWDCDFGLA